ncbi:hypothetical protein [Kutzneria sp. 744]|nr:hypothetical protein [Kutzneria sp. 744]
MVAQFSVVAAVPAIPVLAWELGLAISLIVRGNSRERVAAHVLPKTQTHG